MGVLKLDYQSPRLLSTSCAGIPLSSLELRSTQLFPTTPVSQRFLSGFRAGAKIPLSCAVKASIDR